MYKTVGDNIALCVAAMDAARLAFKRIARYFGAHELADFTICYPGYVCLYRRATGGLAAIIRSFL